MAHRPFFLVLTIFLLFGMTKCQPIDDPEKDAHENDERCVDSEGNQLCRVYGWISDLFGIAKDSVDVFEEVSKLTGMSRKRVKVAQESIDYAQDYFDNVVETGAQFVKDYIPPVKEFINERLEDVSSLGDYLMSQVDELPEEYREDLRARVQSVINILPKEARPHPSITLGIERELPPKKVLKRWVDNMKLLVEGDFWVPPASKRVNDRLDEILEMIDEI